MMGLQHLFQSSYHDELNNISNYTSPRSFKGTFEKSREEKFLRKIKLYWDYTTVEPIDCPKFEMGCIMTES